MRRTTARTTTGLTAVKAKPSLPLYTDTHALVKYAATLLVLLQQPSQTGVDNIGFPVHSRLSSSIVVSCQRLHQAINNALRPASRALAVQHRYVVASLPAVLRAVDRLGLRSVGLRGDVVARRCLGHEDVVQHGAVLVQDLLPLRVGGVVDEELAVAVRVGRSVHTT
jgi:hypothetical protein